MRQQRRGFILLATMAVLVGFLALAEVSLTRSWTELVAAQRYVACTQAFHATEAGLDEVLSEFGRSSGDFLPGEGWEDAPDADPQCRLGQRCVRKPIGVTGAAQCASNLQCVTVVNAGGTPSTITVTGLPSCTQRTLTATVDGGLTSPLNYALVGTTIGLNGGAQIGEPGQPARLYVQNSPISGTSAITVSASNSVYAEHIDFVNPANLTLPELCSRCDNGRNFQPQPLSANLHASRLPDFQTDFMPYYREALRQQSVDGRSYHHVTADTTFANTTLDGVIYVECGVTVTIDQRVTVNGTIVHEGCNGDILLNRGAVFTVNSNSYNFYDPSMNGTPFASGMAIMGAPNLGFPLNSTIDITGFVMRYGGTFTPDGRIEGGIIHVDMAPTWNNPELRFNPGPGPASLITWPIKKANLGGGTTVTFRSLTSPPPGVPTGSRTKILLWQSK